LSRIFAERKQAGGLDLEAVEMGFRAAMHRAGAAALTQLLPFAVPAAGQRGWEHAAKKVVLADGAEWIWNLADLHFPGAIQIVDLYHARQHLWELARKLHPNDAVKQKAWMKKHQRLLDKGKIAKLVLTLRAIDSANSEVVEKLRVETNYFGRNAGRMRYPWYRRQHLLVGSGVIEAGCKNVIGSRLKQSGMFWTVRGANAIVALRCCRLNGQFEDYWEGRRAA
jgi:hypothetical protein